MCAYIRYSEVLPLWGLHMNGVTEVFLTCPLHLPLLLRAVRIGTCGRRSRSHFARAPCGCLVFMQSAHQHPPSSPFRTQAVSLSILFVPWCTFGGHSLGSMTTGETAEPWGGQVITFSDPVPPKFLHMCASKCTQVFRDFNCVDVTRTYSPAL